MRTYPLRTLLVLLIASASTAHASVPVDPRTAQPWDDLVRELEQEGVAADVASVISAALTNPKFEVRMMAADLLGLRGDREGETALRKIVIDDEEVLVREAAAVALVRLGQRDFLKEVRALMRQEPRRSQKLHLAAQLAEFGDFSGYVFVAQAARSEDGHDRLLSAGILGRYLVAGFAGEQAPSPEELLIELLGDRSPRVREEALVHISIAVGDGASVSPYFEIVARMAKKDPDLNVRETALRNLTSWEEQLRHHERQPK